MADEEKVNAASEDEFGSDDDFGATEGGSAEPKEDDDFGEGDDDFGEGDDGFGGDGDGSSAGDDDFGGDDDDFGETTEATAGAETPAEPETPAQPESEPGEPASDEGKDDDGAKGGKGKGARGGVRSRVKKQPLTPAQKLVRAAMKKAGLEELPPLGQLMVGKSGVKMKICDIGIFIEPPTEDALAELGEKCPVPNRCNLSTQVTASHVKSVGASVLTSGRMYQPIQVAKLTDGEGAVEVTSGRHRLVFLALAYGAETMLTVYVEEMTLDEARDAVVVANQARKARALEKAEHAMLAAVGGNAEATNDEIYASMVTTKAKAKKYCTYQTIDKGYPAKLGFPVSRTSSRKEGGLTTITSMEGFWNAAIQWSKGMPRKVFDAKFKQVIEFVNAFVAAAQACDDFDARQHLATMPLRAVGKYYIEVGAEKALESVEAIATALVAMGDIGRQKSDVTYGQLSETLGS